MLHFDGDVVGQVGEFIVQRPGDCHGVGWAVEKIRVAKGHVPGSRSHLLANIGQHNVALNDAEFALVHGHNRAMQTGVFAAPAGLGVAGDRGSIRTIVQAAIVGQRRQAAPPGYAETLLRQGGRGQRWGFPGRQPQGQICERAFEFAADDGVGAEACQGVMIDWAIKAIATNVGAGVHTPQPGQQFRRHARRSVHGNVDRDQRGRPGRILIQRLHRQIVADDVEPGFGQPRGRGRQTKGLMPQVIGGQQQRRCRGLENDYFPGWKYGFLPSPCSVVSMTATIEGTLSLIATSTPCFNVTSAMPQPWQPPSRRI